MNYEQPTYTNYSRLMPALIEAAELYQKNLVGSSLLIIGRHLQQHTIDSIELTFREENFMHLTGFNGRPALCPKQFYDMCLAHRLPLDKCTISSEASKKLAVLPMLCEPRKGFKMYGKYNESGDLLSTESVSGNIKGCLGFVRDKETDVLVPNTALEGDIRTMAKELRQVQAIYQKRICDDRFPENPIYLCKDLRRHSKELIWPMEIAAKILPAKDWMKG